MHDWLRAELKAVRAQADAIVGGAGVAISRPAPDLAQQLRMRCAGFCTALSRRHHGGEDAVVFPQLAEQFPALGPTLAQLAEQHQAVARLQRSIQQLVDGFVPGESDPERLRSDLDRLAGELEAHFDFEERAVVTALNATAAAPPIA
ncbi:hemerythrin domain-containing protein [Amycolatopsis benzoatilytica]|uniref:hemerythrin domain-containing protein n=1 Tax=Amycolatopsis benzoatilytica TaxID=346045 RepID=UPI0003A3F67E|nr:hemerythrin domain-containing protein [Amycolatopsis benzoatilytica]